MLTSDVMLPKIPMASPTSIPNRTDSPVGNPDINRAEINNDGSGNAERSTRFTRWLQPEKELALNWSIDVAAVLHEYLQTLTRGAGGTSKCGDGDKNLTGSGSHARGNGIIAVAAAAALGTMHMDFVEVEIRVG